MWPIFKQNKATLQKYVPTCPHWRRVDESFHQLASASFYMFVQRSWDLLLMLLSIALRSALMRESFTNHSDLDMFHRPRQSKAIVCRLQSLRLRALADLASVDGFHWQMHPVERNRLSQCPSEAALSQWGIWWRRKTLKWPQMDSALPWKTEGKCMAWTLPAGKSPTMQPPCNRSGAFLYHVQTRKVSLTKFHQATA